MTDLYNHPQYIERAPFYRVYRDLYEGIHAVLRKSDYLWLHELETGKTDASNRLRAIREMRTRYDNEVEPVVSRYTSLFFKEDPIIGKKTLDLFGGDVENVTGTGKSLITFLKEDVLLSLLIYGRPIVLTDSYDLALKNQAEQKAAKARPYFESINPLDVKDWELDKEGNYTFLRYECSLVKPRASAQAAPVIGLYTKEFVLNGGGYDVNTYEGKKRTPQQRFDSYADSEEKKALEEQRQAFLSAEDWTQISTKHINAPRIPIRSLEGHDSWIKDTSQLALKLYNKQSCRDSIHYYQGHQRVFIKGVNSDEQRKALAEYTIGYLPTDGDAFVLEPVSTQSLDDDIQRIKEDIRRGAFNQSRGTTTDSKQVEAAATQQEAKEGIISLIKSEIEALENLAKGIIKDYALFKTGDANFEPEIVFQKDIEVEDIDQEIAIYNALRGDITRCPTWYRETLKKFATHQDLEDSEEIAKEIDALKPVDPMQMQQQGRPNPVETALNGRAKQLPKAPTDNGSASTNVSSKA